MQKLFHLLRLASACLLLTAFVQGRPAEPVGGPCEGCDAYAVGLPARLDWQTTLNAPDEPGGTILLEGTVFRRDGRTPAANVILYVWQTDATGHYRPALHLTGEARRHGVLRGWMQTNERGEYRLRTIRPGAYPGHTEPAHIHVVVKEPGLNSYYLDDWQFTDDPLLTPRHRQRAANRGGSGICELQPHADGFLTARRNITLGLNIPNYP